MDVKTVLTLRFTPDVSVCSSEIIAEITDKKIERLVLHEGCEGCNIWLSALLHGKSVRQAMKLGWGVVCGERKTSCGDQLAKALQQQFPEISRTRDEALAKKRLRYPNTGERWDEEQDQTVARLYSEGDTPEDISPKTGRTPIAIIERLVRQGLLTRETAEADLGQRLPSMWARKENPKKTENNNVSLD